MSSCVHGSMSLGVSYKFISDGDRFLGGDSWSCMSKLTNLSALIVSFSGDPSRRLPATDSSWVGEALKDEGRFDLLSRESHPLGLDYFPSEVYRKNGGAYSQPQVDNPVCWFFFWFQQYLIHLNPGSSLYNYSKLALYTWAIASPLTICIHSPRQLRKRLATPSANGTDYGHFLYCP